MMGEESKIEWTTHTFNPWRGCTKVSAGCANCYAETMSGRNHSTLGVWGPSGTRVVASESMWKEPVKWDRDARCDCPDGPDKEHIPDCPQRNRPRVFCASLADVFEDWNGPMSNARGELIEHEHIGNAGDQPAMMTMADVRVRLFNLIAWTRNLDWLLLTKRAENLREMWTMTNWPNMLPNVWLGVSVEDQQAADKRIPLLLKAPAKVRFLSVEPLLGPVDLSPWLESLNWLIVGGESGPGARPCNVDWIRDIVRQCRDAGVACFVKQLGSSPEGDELLEATGKVKRDRAGKTTHIQLRRKITDKKGGDMDEWPEDLRVRHFPNGAK